MHRVPATLLAAALGIFPPTLRAADSPPELARRAWTLLSQKCLACHGNDPDKIKGGLNLTTRAGALAGGESERPVLAPGRPDESLLYLAAARKDPDLPMPPKENDKLTGEQVKLLREWILAGAPWPEENAPAGKAWDSADGMSVKTSGGLSPEWTNRKYKPENLWAYQPLRKPTVPPTQTRNPIDAFLAAKFPASVKPAPPADRRTLIRRATFDLTGLPPTPEEIEAFVKDRAPDDRAFAQVVERLLASPHYGEQWGGHWLDVVRYADSSGFANDFARGSAWRYRDYVIRAFNRDKPYDQFIREQIAGDELWQNSKPETRNPELLVAAGFLRMGPWELTGMEVARVARQRFLDDVTQTVGETFLAHALQCARCHDHKFDPLPTRDYYSVQACFATTQLAERDAPFLDVENTSGFDERKFLEARRQEHLAMLKRLDEKSLAEAAKFFAGKKLDPAKWDAAVAAARQQEGKGGRREFEGVFNRARNRLAQQGVPEEQYPPKLYGFSPEDFGNERVARKGLERLRWEFDRYEPVAFSVYDGRTPDVKAVLAPTRMPAGRMTAGELEEVAILAGGDPFAPAAKVAPGVLSVVELFTASYVEGVQTSQIPTGIEGRRLALANWIASPQNPLTARTMVNRIWLWHFGQAIAGNPNNFGATGKKPTHPELLDWLAATFIERGWSVKAMHRLIMSSEAYRRSAECGARNGGMGRGELEKIYAVFQPRRLSAEELRDAMLRVTGELNATLGGIPNRPEMNLEAALQPRQVMGTFAEAWQPDPKPEQRHRRSIYALKIRGQRDPFMEVFNSPSPDLSCEARDALTVTPQVFSLFNSRASYDRALAFAARLLKEGKPREQTAARAVQLAFGRPPRADETRAMLAHWDAMTARHRALKFDRWQPPREVVREAVEENTGEKFRFTERLAAAEEFVPDLQPADADAATRGLAEVCLVLFNANEFAYVY